MTLPATLFALRWLVWDTFRQSLAARTFWLLLALSGVCILFCLSVGVTGKGVEKPAGEAELIGGDDQPFTGLNPGGGRLTLGFGLVRVGLPRDTRASIHFLQALLGRWVGGAFGTLVLLVWTAGFLPEFLQPANASLQLAKPLPRGTLLAGKYLGVLAFVAVQVAVFVGGTWLALGARTGIWDLPYLLSAPLLLFHFAVVYSVSALLAVVTRSVVLSALGSVVFWFACAALNHARHGLVAGTLTASEAVRQLAETAYWVLPKPADFGVLLHRGLRSGVHFELPREFENVQAAGAFHPELSLLTSLAFAVVVLMVAGIVLVRRDY
jgi:hypothetical protein